jgi:hypothetical protein
MSEKDKNKAMVGNTKSDGWRGSRWRIAVWGGAALLLLLPLVAMQFSDEWDWGVFDFVFAAVLLFGSLLTYELIARMGDDLAYKAGAGVAVVAALLLVWINAAVGIIGDDESINLLYFGVLATGLIGAFLARFEAQGMARASFAMAIAQMLVPVIVLAIPNLRDALMEPPGVLGVIVLNLFFAMLFVTAAFLFQKAAQGEADGEAGQDAV